MFYETKYQKQPAVMHPHDMLINLKYRIAKNRHEEFLMRIVVEKKDRTFKRDGKDVTEETSSRNVKFGKEDVLLVFVVALILVGLGIGKLTFEQALAYIGISTSGGVWGLLSGNASEK